MQKAIKAYYAQFGSLLNPSWDLLTMNIDDVEYYLTINIDSIEYYIEMT